MLELSSLSGVAFITMQIGLVATILYFYMVGREDGVPLPSNNIFVRQMFENYIPVIIATLLEPVWILLTRLLCILQPLEQLSYGNVMASNSISLIYSNVPPQLTLFKALRARHYTIASACMAALLANVLAVASGGMFIENSMAVAGPANMTGPYQATFKDVPEACFQDEGGDNHFYIAMANLTSGTPLPPWTDDQAFYMPFSVASGMNRERTYESVSRAFGPQVVCQPLKQQTANSYELDLFPSYDTSVANLTTNIRGRAFDESTCVSASIAIQGQFPGLCVEGDSGLEFITRVSASPSASSGIKHACGHTIIAAWMRSPDSGLCLPAMNSSVPLVKVTDREALVVACHLDIVTRTVDLTINADNIVQAAVSREDWSDDIEQYFRGSLGDLLTTINGLVISPSYSTYNAGFSPSGTWHNIPFACDWNNYLMKLISGNDSFLDPTSPLPASEDMIPLFQTMYSRLFSIWLGTNYKKLLPESHTTGPPVPGSEISQEKRIFMSKPMFLIAETILAFYVVVSLAIYIKPPGRFLR